MNPCKNCKHFWEMKLAGRVHAVYCLVLNGQEHPVYGEKIDGILCESNRIGGPCGWEGRLYEEKEQAK